MQRCCSARVTAGGGADRLLGKDKCQARPAAVTLAGVETKVGNDPDRVIAEIKRRLKF